MAPRLLATTRRLGAAAADVVVGVTVRVRVGFLSLLLEAAGEHLDGLLSLLLLEAAGEHLEGGDTLLLQRQLRLRLPFE